ncbi:hypothetical protein HK097_004360, partial [Rhizophlyctis rosea]
MMEVPPILTFSPPTHHTSQHHITSKSPIIGSLHSPRLIPVFNGDVTDHKVASAAEGKGMIGQHGSGRKGGEGVLKTPRLVLVPLRGGAESEGDVGEFLKGIEKEGWFGVSLPSSTTSSNSSTPLTPTPTTPSTYWTIELRSPPTHTTPRTLIGLIAITYPYASHALLSLFIDSSHRSQGYATEAAKRVL